MLKRVVSVVVAILIVVGVWRGIINYNHATGDNLLARLGGTVVNTIADITYNWLPWVVNHVGGDWQRWIPAPPGPGPVTTGVVHTTGVHTTTTVPAPAHR